jgi:hypothetical protein
MKKLLYSVFLLTTMFGCSKKNNTVPISSAIDPAIFQNFNGQFVGTKITKKVILDTSINGIVTQRDTFYNVSNMVSINASEIDINGEKINFLPSMLNATNDTITVYFLLSSRTPRNIKISKNHYSEYRGQFSPVGPDSDETWLELNK